MIGPSYNNDRDNSWQPTNRNVTTANTLETAANGYLEGEQWIADSRRRCVSIFWCVYVYVYVFLLLIIITAYSYGNLLLGHATTMAMATPNTTPITTSGLYNKEMRRRWAMSTVMLSFPIIFFQFIIIVVVVLAIIITRATQASTTMMIMMATTTTTAAAEAGCQQHRLEMRQSQAPVCLFFFSFTTLMFVLNFNVDGSNSSSCNGSK